MTVSTIRINTIDLDSLFGSYKVSQIKDADYIVYLVNLLINGTAETDLDEESSVAQYDVDSSIIITASTSAITKFLNEYIFDYCVWLDEKTFSEKFKEIHKLPNDSFKLILDGEPGYNWQGVFVGLKNPDDAFRLKLSQG